MPTLVLAAFISIIGIEIAGFIRVGDWLGLWITLAITLTTAAIGMSLLRRQGVAALRQVQKSVEDNRTPLPDVLNGFILLIAGALLLLPGFFSDGIGFILFLPQARQALLIVVVDRIHAASDSRKMSRGDIIDGAFIDLTDTTPPANSPRLPSDGE